MKNTEIQERILRPAHGIPVLILELVLIAVSLLLMIGGVVLLNWSPVFGVAAIVVGPILLIADCICFAGLKSVRPNEALVLTLFGSYHGTVKEPGFYFVNPFCSAVSPAYDKAAAEAMKKAKEADSHSSASTPVVVSARRCSAWRTIRPFCQSRRTRPSATSRGCIPMTSSRRMRTPLRAKSLCAAARRR